MKSKNVAIDRIDIDKNTLGMFSRLGTLHNIAMQGNVYHDNPIFWAMLLTNIVKKKNVPS